MARNSHIPRVGLITTMSLDTTWPQAVVDHAESIHKRAKELMAELGYEVVAGQGIFRTNAEMVGQGAHLRSQGAEVLVLQVATWTYSNTSIAAALECDLPVIVWSDASPGSYGIVGASIVRGSLDTVGVKNKLIHGTADDPEFVNKLDLLVRSFSAARRLRGQTFGNGGFRSMGMYTAVIDPIEWRTRFGVDVDNWEQGAIVERARSMDDKEPRRFLEWVKGEFGKVVPREEVMLAQIRMYLALKELVEQKNYDFIAVKCLPELPSCYTTFCLAIALFNDRSDFYGPKESLVCACESDANGALTMQFLRLLSGGPALFADVLKFDANTGEMTLCNCGSQPTDLAKCRKDVFWETEGLREFQWVIGGACPQYVGKPGEVTLARLGRIQDRHFLMLTRGTAIEREREALREVNYQQPQVFIKLHCTPEGFLETLRSNHLHMVYGDYTEHLRAMCGILDIDVIEPR